MERTWDAEVAVPMLSQAALLILDGRDNNVYGVGLLCKNEVVTKRLQVWAQLLGHPDPVTGVGRIDVVTMKQQGHSVATARQPQHGP